MKREDVVRSILNALATDSRFYGDTITVDQFATDLGGLSRWYELHMVSLIPRRTKMDCEVNDGTLRVVCRTRKKPDVSGNTSPITEPWEMADNVTGALRGATVLVKDWVDNGGTTTIGCASFDEVQSDDVGQAEDQIHTLICTAQFLVSAAA